MFLSLGGFECPPYTNDLCIMVVEPWLDVTVNLILILSAELFGNGLCTGTDFFGWNAVISVVLCSERDCNLEQVGAVDVKRLTDIDSCCIEQCLLRINPPSIITCGRI